MLDVGGNRELLKLLPDSPNSMENWSGKDEYLAANATQFLVDQNGDGNPTVAGYLTSVQNLRLLSVRNAGHMVPRSKPLVGLEIFKQFLAGTL